MGRALPKGDGVKLLVDRFVYEPPGLSIVPETEFEAAVLSRYWESATLTIGRALSDSNSADGRAYVVKFHEPEAKK